MTKASLFSILIPLLLSISLQSIFAFTPYKDPVTQVGKTGPAIVIYNNGSTQVTAPTYQTPKPTPASSKTPSSTRSSTMTSAATPLNEEGEEGDEYNPKKPPTGVETNKGGGAVGAEQEKKKSNNIGIYIGVGIVVLVLLGGGVALVLWYRARQLRRFSRMPAHTWKMLNDPNNKRRVDSELLEPPPFLPEVRTSNSSWHRYVSTVWTSRNNSNVNVSQQESHRPSNLQDVVLRS